VAVVNLPYGRLALVVEGFEGRRGPNSLCEVVAYSVRRHLESARPEQGDVAAVQMLLCEAVTSGMRRGTEASGSSAAKSGTEPGLAAVLVARDRIFLAHAGRTQVLVIREGTPLLVTKDPGAGPGACQGMAQARGHKTGEEDAPAGSAIRGTRADLEIGDVVVVSSRGVYDVVPPHKIVAAVTQYPSEVACIKLIEASNAAGGQLNISTVVYQPGPPSAARHETAQEIAQRVTESYAAPSSQATGSAAGASAPGASVSTTKPAGARAAVGISTRAPQSRSPKSGKAGSSARGASIWIVLALLAVAAVVISRPWELLSGSGASVPQTTTLAEGSKITPDAAGAQPSAAAQTNTAERKPAVVPGSLKEVKPPVVPENVAGTKPAVVPAKAGDSKPAVVPGSVKEAKPPVVPGNVAETKPAVVSTNVAETKPAVVSTNVAETEPAVVSTNVAETKPAVAAAEVAERKPVAVPAGPGPTAAGDPLAACNADGLSSVDRKWMAQLQGQVAKARELVTDNKAMEAGNEFVKIRWRVARLSGEGKKRCSPIMEDVRTAVYREYLEQAAAFAGQKRCSLAQARSKEAYNELKAPIEEVNKALGPCGPVKK